MLALRKLKLTHVVLKLNASSDLSCWWARPFPLGIVRESPAKNAVSPTMGCLGGESQARACWTNECHSVK